MVKDAKTGKPRGYACIEFEDRESFLSILSKDICNNSNWLEAYKQSDGKKIDGSRIKTDCELGRTAKGWIPRRFGGGKGDTRKKREKGEKLKK